MKTFAAVINKHKASKHQIPPGQGWKTRQQVARELGVNPRDLRDHLADAITAKDIEEKKFSEWDAATMKAIPVTCYRLVEKAEPKVKKKPTKISVKTSAAVEGIPPHLLERITQTCKRYAGYSPAHIADRCRWANEPRIKAPAIRVLLDKLSHN
jgi:hypothetical protein